MKEFIFTWCVENYSFFSNYEGEELVSPTFTANAMDETAWTLSLYPRCIGDGSEECISIYLSRAEFDKSTETYAVNYVLSFLAVDGTPLQSLDISEDEFTFNRGDGYGDETFVNRLEVLSQRRDEYLPKDTLTARCRMWKGTGDISEIVRILARTKIGIERISFEETVQGLDDLKPNQNKDIHIKSPKLRSLMSMTVSLSEGTISAKTVVLKIRPINSEQVKVIACKLFMPTATGGAVEWSRGEVRFDVHDTEESTLHFSIPENDFDKQVTFTLQCDATFSTGELVTNQIEQTIYDCQSIPNYTPIPHDENECEACISLSSRGGALDDFRSLYNDRIIADVKMKTKTESFPAHKAVLCARSPVFRAMFVNDMREKTSDCIDVPDLQDETIHRFLLFLYTDSVEDLQWDIAIKLYYAADKYQVQKLKEKCSSFLLENINNSNSIELLVLVDMHQDADLEKGVVNFILQHEEEVFGSDAWVTFTGTHPKLAVKTMCLKYKR